MSDPREEILFAADDDFWGAWIENREMLAQAKDSELAERGVGSDQSWIVRGAALSCKQSTI